jgi:cell division protein FtsQ
MKRRAKSSRKPKGESLLATTVAPLILLAVILGCLGFLLFMGYRTVTASAFFDVHSIEVRGANRVSREEVERVVRAETARTSVWNADLETMRGQIEKMPFVKSVAVSRILPDGIRVNITERVPRAIARTGAGDFWVDDDAFVLGKAEKNDLSKAFVIAGWDENKSEKAARDNQERVKIAVRLREDLKNIGIENRVAGLNLTSLQEPQVTVEDSGETVSVFLGKEDFGKRLQKALEVLEGRGKQIESLISHGSYPIARFRSS